MNYHLDTIKNTDEKYLARLWRSIREFSSYLDKKQFLIAFGLVIISALSDILTPFLLGVAIDSYISKNDIAGLIPIIGTLLALFIVSAVTSYFQQSIMGRASNEALYKLRSAIFEKIQSLPIAFFSQNKRGDLMSRINNDTNKISQFLSESILRFVDGAFTLFGISIFIFFLNFKLALVLLSSTVFLLIFTRIVSPYLEKINKRSSAALGDFTAGVSEQLVNFKAIIAFDRRNFFENFLNDLNFATYKRSRLASFLNQIFSPIYDFAGYIAQVVVLVYGIVLIAQGEITIGLLVGFLGYAIRFYEPLRWIASIFADIQVSLASWGRIRDILQLSSNLEILREDENSGLAIASRGIQKAAGHTVMSWEGVSFGYDESSSVLKNVSFELCKGNTYALVGPTGGGKSTIANLMARLYDPTAGSIFWKGKDIRSIPREELVKSIGFILQEPFLFSGTVAENMWYGNEKLVGEEAKSGTEMGASEMNEEKLAEILEAKGMTELIKRLPKGLKTEVQSGGENISIGQKQLISFVRTILREPEFLILDEATANIDTVTEAVLQQLLDSLPKETTKVIIAHRLNTIKKADEILFVGGGEVKRVADEKEVVELLRGK